MWFLWCLFTVVVNFYDIGATELRGTIWRPSDQKCHEYIWEINNRQRERNEHKYEMKEIKYPSSKSRHNRNRNLRKRPLLGIHRGKTTSATEYPHMGALGWYSLLIKDWDFLCGASLISTNFLLTAAHCTKVSNKMKIYDTLEPKIVRLGSRNIRRSNYEVFHDYDIDQIKVHEKYMSPNNYYDIALLRLARQVHFNKFIHPACLETAVPTTAARNRKYTVTGWGVVAHAGKMVDNLRYGEVDLIDQKKCDFYLYPYRSRNWNKTAPHQICAGKMDGSIDTCNGDSGGPLQYKLLHTANEGTMHVIVGITAFGSTRCATKNLPSLYTKVLYFVPWIEAIVWPTETTAFYNKYVHNRRVSLHRRRHFKNNF